MSQVQNHEGVGGEGQAGAPAPKILSRAEFETQLAAYEAQGPDVVNFLASFREFKIKPEVRQIHDRYDDQIKGLTGVQKNQGESTYQMLNRVFTEGLVVPKTKVEQLLKEVETKAPPQGDAANTNPQTGILSESESVKLLNGEVQALRKQLEDSQKAAETEKFNAYRESIGATVNGLNLFVPEHISDDEKPGYLNTKRAYMTSQLTNQLTQKVVDGQRVFYKGDQPVLNAEGKPSDLVGIITSEFKYDLAPERPATPPPTTPTGLGGNRSPRTVSAPTSLTTLPEVAAYVHDELKMTPNTKASQAKVLEIATQLNIK